MSETSGEFGEASDLDLIVAAASMVAEQHGGNVAVRRAFELFVESIALGQRMRAESAGGSV